jgi:hypothetical protein
MMTSARQIWHNKALDAEPPIASFLKSMLIGGGPVNATVLYLDPRLKCVMFFMRQF